MSRYPRRQAELGSRSYCLRDRKAFFCDVPPDYVLKRPQPSATRSPGKLSIMGQWRDGPSCFGVAGPNRRQPWRGRRGADQLHACSTRLMSHEAGTSQEEEEGEKERGGGGDVRSREEGRDAKVQGANARQQ
uniref:Uncharacterized protein n=1 Tax=Knipowitschia caucasica TaxID=637954 RepID=A0AAV2MHF3_KNICA